MKYLCVFLCALVAVVVVNGQGIPTKTCPPGEHTVLYCPRKSEPDCSVPEVHDLPQGSVGACGIPDCFCDKPTVRNRDTGKCVSLSQCPNKGQ